MDIDLHCHAKLSKKSTFNHKHLLKTMQAARRTGLQGIAVTEHFNAKGFCAIYEMLDLHYPYREGHYDIGGLKVFCGMEVEINEGGHVLLIGKREDVLNLHKELAPFRNQKNFPSLGYLAEEADKRKMIKIGAHPFRRDNSLGCLPGDILKQLDYLELNGKDYKERNKVFQLADCLGLPVVAGSDSHQWLQVGCVRNRLERDCSKISEVRDCIEEGSYETIISSGINLKLTCARIVKKILKKITDA